MDEASENRADTAKDPEAVAAALLAIVAELAREARPGAAVRARMDSSLERDLGIDSLARVELLLRVERAFGARLPEHLLAAAETPRDLLRAVLGSAALTAAAAQVTPIGQAPLAGEETPEAAASVNEALDWHVAAHPQRVHILLLEGDAEAVPIRYGELREEAGRVAAGLAQRGVGPGSTVAIMLPTGRDFFRAFLGVLLAGAVPVPIYPPLRRAQLEDHLRRQSGILANCEARLLITLEEARDVAALLRDRVPTLAETATTEELAGAPAATALPSARAQDLALLQYTSGSTGNPKGVMLTHANLLANIRAMGLSIGASSSDVFVSWLPLYHDMGLIGAWLGSLYFAFPLVVMPPTSFLARPPRWLWAVHRYRGTLTSAPNFAYEMCASRVDERELEGLDLSSLRFAFNGAEPVSPDTLARFAARFARYGFDPAALAPVYGLAECAVGLAFPPAGRGPLIDRVERGAMLSGGAARPARADDETALCFPACGRPLPGHQVRAVDARGRELPERIEGRIEFRGPSATAGYYRNAEATRALFDGEWLDTGDLGYLAGGEIHLTSRAKDVIIRGGQHVHPYELEEAVGNLAGMRKGCVAVFGVPDPVSGTERIVVLAETRVAGDARREALRRAIGDLALQLLGTPADDIVLAPPRTVLKTSSGKIRRAASRQLYERGLAGAGQRAAWLELARFAWTAARGRLRRGALAGLDRLYAAYVWSVFLALALVALAVLVVPGVGRRRAAARALARVLMFASGLPLLVHGMENFPRGGAVTVVANHQSYLDSIILCALLPAGVTYVAKRELGEAMVLGPLLRAIGVRFVERFDFERGSEDARELSRLAAAGESLVFFPEGTFTRAPGLQPFRMGAFVASANAGVPVQPIAIRGARSVLRDSDWRLRRGAIQVLVGPLLRADGEDWAAAVRLRERARAEILARCGEPDLAGPA